MTRAEAAAERALAASQRATRAAERRTRTEVKADAREAARQQALSRTEEAAEMKAEALVRAAAISSLLLDALAHNPALDPLADAEVFAPRHFDGHAYITSAPVPEEYKVEPLGFFARFWPGATARHREGVEAAERRYQKDLARHLEIRAAREAAVKAFRAEEDARKAEIEEGNAALTSACKRVATGDHDAVVDYIERIFEKTLKKEHDGISASAGYSPASRHLVVDLELPDFSVVPEEAGYRYVKTGDRIEAVPLPMAKRRALYASLLAQVVLKGLDTVFRGTPAGVVECATLNGMLDALDPATGQQVRVCLISVRVTADTFGALNLVQVDPEQCLRALKASVSRAPAELAPVKPIVELDMVDPRFVDTLNVLSGLDTRPNLMDLTPTEFEGLITNTFAAMGLETRQTRPSRDGGVDCVAWDPRPIFGGKVVVQAKRYKNTVSVSAVRDLFGTVQNEGASKGILVTTSGYGKAAYDFAKGKPLELLDGANLLHLLAEYAKIEARIITPEGWKDLPTHGE